MSKAKLLQKTLPDGWTFVEVRNLKIVGYKHLSKTETEPILEDTGLKKTCSLPKEHLIELNAQKFNTLLFYKAVDYAPEDALTPDQEAEKTLEVIEAEKAQERADLKAELVIEVKADLAKEAGDKLKAEEEIKEIKYKADIAAINKLLIEPLKALCVESKIEVAEGDTVKTLREKLITNLN